MRLGKEKEEPRATLRFLAWTSEITELPSTEMVSKVCLGSEFFFFFKRKVILNLFIYLFIYFWLCWVFVSVWGLSLVAASGGHSLSWPLLLWSTGSRRAGSVVVAHGPSCSVACGIFPDQGSNPCPPHWQADSQPLRHQGSPGSEIFNKEWEMVTGLAAVIIS